MCHDGREGEQGASFLCPNGTLFNQHEFACDWWYNVNCADAPRLYEYVPKIKITFEFLVAGLHLMVDLVKLFNDTGIDGGCDPAKNSIILPIPYSIYFSNSDQKDLLQPCGLICISYK